MTDLAERKRLLVAEGELHRQLIVMERLHLRAQSQQLRESVVGNRWWWVAGAAVAGWFVTRGGISSVARSLPSILSIARMIRSMSR